MVVIEKRAALGAHLGAVRVAACLALCAYSGWMTNEAAFAYVAPTFPPARDAAMLASAFVWALSAAAAYYAPRLLSRRVWLAGSVAMLFGACLAAFVGAVGVSPLLACAFCVLYSASFIFPQMMVVTGLSLLETNKHRLACIAAALVAASLARCLPAVSSVVGGAALHVAIFAVVVALMWRQCGAMLDKVSSGALAADLQAQSPRSFLAPMHALFSCVFLVAAISSFGSMLALDGQSASWSYAVNACIVVVAFACAFKNKASEDALFSFVYLGLLGGLLLVPFVQTGVLPLARAAIGACSVCFSMLYWLVISSVGARNPFALMPTLGIASCAESLGVAVGAVLASVALGISDSAAMGLLSAGAAFTIAAFIWVFFKRFSFTETVRGVEPTREITPSTEADGGLLDQRSGRVAARCGLTDREGEILGYLAHGRNTRYIQEKLVISPNTVRTHIKHIYQKLGVHSQQELIDVVSAEDL